MIVSSIVSSYAILYLVLSNSTAHSAKTNGGFHNSSIQLTYPHTASRGRPHHLSGFQTQSVRSVADREDIFYMVIITTEECNHPLNYSNNLIQHFFFFCNNSNLVSTSSKRNGMATSDSSLPDKLWESLKASSNHSWVDYNASTKVEQTAPHVSRMLERVSRQRLQKYKPIQRIFKASVYLKNNVKKAHTYGNWLW